MNTYVEELFKICEKGEFDKIKGLDGSHFYYSSKRISYANYSREDGHTPFHVAIIGGHLDMVKFLYETKGADLNYKDYEGRASGYIASMSDQYNILRYLVKQGCDINQKSHNYWRSPLHHCIHYQSVKNLKVLLELGADVNIRTIAGDDALHYAVFEAKLDMVQELVNYGMDVNSKAEDGRTLFIAATSPSKNKKESLLIVRYLAQQGADIFQRGGEKNITAMHNISSPEIGNFLLDQGLSVIDKDSDGHIPLYNYLLNYHPKLDIIKFFIFNGSNINTQGEHGHTSLHFAAMFGDMDLLNYLLANQVDISLKESQRGRTPLHLAVVYRKFEVLEAVLDYGDDMESRGSDGSTALQWACATLESGEHRLTRAEWLIERGADINTQDDDGMGCLHWAVKNFLSETEENDTRALINYLIKSGIDQGLRDKKGLTAEDTAQKLGKNELLELFIK